MRGMTDTNTKTAQAATSSNLDAKFDPNEAEAKHYGAWESAGAFQCNVDSDKTPFTVMMPPPNVTGSLHMGHAFNATLHDVLTRWNRMRGRDALWQPGLDHAGIATQMVVERQLAEKDISRRDLGREKFVEKVWDWKAESGGTIIDQFKHMGVTPDWSRERFTMDEGLSRAVRKVFVKMHKDGLIYRDKRLVNWDPKLQTAVSDIEVIHKDIKGKMYHVKYALEDGSGFISIATTRPETILADGAIAVHPDDEKYTDLVGKFAVVPICNRVIPIVADEYVKADFGSGAVKITAAHDYNDFEVYTRHKDKGIPLINLMTPDGKMNENCPDDYIGLDRFEARKKVIADLDELEFLEKVESHTHQVPYGDRSGVVIEPYLTDQWYVDAQTLAKPAIEAVETGAMKFVPQNWENTYFEWMRNIQPWCISRQLWWGHQIPAWYDEGGNIFVAETQEEAQAQAGADAKLTQDDDVLDTWFSSGLWPFSTLGWPDKTPELEKYYPGDVLITGFDIIFFWVARMMMMGLYVMDDVPFKTVYMHALVRDAKGQKMSKSKGNVMNPLELTEKYGADALRFTFLAMAAQGRDIKLSEDRVAGYRNFGTKLWNAARYCEMNGALDKGIQEDFDPSAVAFTPNQWIVSEIIKTQAAIDEALENYQFNAAAAAVYSFVWGTFCDWYLEFTKPVLQGESNTQERANQAAEVRATTGWVLGQILHLLNPFMPTITEELREKLNIQTEGQFLMTSPWPEYDLELDGCASQKMDWLIRIISEIRSVRADMNVPASAKIKLLVKDACGMSQDGLKTYDEILRRMARLESVELTDTAPKGSLQTVVDNITLILPIADIIDLDKEKERLEKEIDKLDGDIDKIDRQLANEKFVANAPPEIITEQHSRKEIALTTKSKLQTALKQLQAA
jgi:valyl-tRNA synthetase